MATRSVNLKTPLCAQYTRLSDDVPGDRLARVRSEVRPFASGPQLANHLAAEIADSDSSPKAVHRSAGFACACTSIRSCSKILGNRDLKIEVHGVGPKRFTER